MYLCSGFSRIALERAGGDDGGGGDCGASRVSLGIILEHNADTGAACAGAPEGVVHR